MVDSALEIVVALVTLINGSDLVEWVILPLADAVVRIAVKVVTVDEGWAHLGEAVSAVPLYAVGVNPLPVVGVIVSALNS